MKNKKNRSNKEMGKPVIRERTNPRRKEAHNDIDDLPLPKISDADRHVDDIIRKYNDFAIIDRD